jgi:hypothetical protein
VRQRSRAIPSVDKDAQVHHPFQTSSKLRPLTRKHHTLARMCGLAGSVSAGEHDSACPRHIMFVLVCSRGLTEKGQSESKQHVAHDAQRMNPHASSQDAVRTKIENGLRTRSYHSARPRLPSSSNFLLKRGKLPNTGLCENQTENCGCHSPTTAESVIRIALGFSTPISNLASIGPVTIKAQSRVALARTPSPEDLQLDSSRSGC